MTENPRPPVAVRIVRPYESEDELLEYELETIGKTSVILIGAHTRPTGVILRFEVVLTSGTPVLRGEGRVLGHKDQAFRGQPGLALRFTRLDPKSKALVDRATAMREARSMGGSAQIPIVTDAGSAPHSATHPGFPAPPSAPREPSPTTPDVPEAVARPEPSRAPSQRPPAVRPSQRPPTVRPGASQPPPSVRPSGRNSARPDPALARALTEDTPPPPRASRPPRGASTPPRAPSQIPPAGVPAVTLQSVRPTATSEPDLAPALAAALRETPVPAPPPAETATAPDTVPPEEPPPSEPELSPDLVPTPYAGVVSIPPRRSAPPPAMAAPSVPPAPVPRAAATAFAADPGREAVLARLRERARGLSTERVAEILASRRPRP